MLFQIDQLVVYDGKYVVKFIGENEKGITLLCEYNKEFRDNVGAGITAQAINAKEWGFDNKYIGLKVYMSSNIKDKLKLFEKKYCKICLDG